MWISKRILPAMLFSAAALAAMPACATGTYGYRGDYGREREVERRAYDSGYRDGLKQGERDARDRRVFDVERHDDWRDADDGYHRDYGDRELYRRVFRDGFRVGYSEAYNRIASRDRDGRIPPVTYPSAYPAPGVVIAPRATYVSPAAQNGYRDGLEQGRDDARDRDRYDPIRAKRYREGDHDYHDRYGSREEYKREYRAAFQQGYDEGYRTYRR
jgi:hypothetical protein